MRKIDAKAEKNLRNAEYALRFKKREAIERSSKFLNWCRVKGHASTCEVRTCPSH